MKTIELQSAELPEHRPFHVHRNCDQTPCGPYSQRQIVVLLNSGFLSRTDWVYYENLGRWEPLHAVFTFEERVINHQDDGQDEKLFHEIFLAMSQLSWADERIYYIAHQPVSRVPFLKRPMAVAVTSQALWWGSVHKDGYFEANCLFWEDVGDIAAHHPRRWDEGTLRVTPTYRRPFSVPRLPRRQLRSVIDLARGFLYERRHAAAVSETEPAALASAG